MLQFVSLATVLAVASAYTTGYSTLGNLRYGGARRLAYGTTGLLNTGLVNTGLVGLNTGYTTGLVNGFSGLGLARGYSTGYAGGYTYGQAAVAPLAVQTSHQVQYADVPSGGQISPISVDIDASPIPINMLFKSASSQLNVQQAHQGAAGSVQESQSEDEAHVLRHSVTKPVIQEVREVITPFRRINQEVQPVQEQINTVVARGTAQRAIAVAAPVQTVQTFAPAVQTVQAVRAIAAPAQYVQTVAAPLQYVNRGVVGFSGYGARNVVAAPLATGVQYSNEY